MGMHNSAHSLVATKLKDLDVDSGTLSVDEVNNRVGFGDTAPGTQIQVKGTTPYVTLQNSTAENTAGGCEGRVIFEDHANAALAQVEGSHSGTSDDTKGKLILSTHNGSALTAALTIDDAQSVTIAGDLTVNGTTTTINSTTLTVDDKTIVIASGAADSAAADGAGITVDGASASILYDHTGTQWEMNKPLEVTGALSTTSTATVGTDLTVTGGDVSFGNGQNATVSVAATGSGTDGKDLTIEAGSAPAGSANQSGGDLVLKAGGGDGTGTSIMTFATKVNGTDAVAERMRIHSDGNIGIGDAAPGTQVQVTGATPYVTLQNNTAENSEGGCESRIIFEDHANAALAQVEGSHSGTSDDTKGKLIFSTHTGSSLTTAMTINETQQVIIPDGKLILGSTALASTASEIDAACDSSGRTAAAVDVSADHFLFCDGGATGAAKVESLADLMTAVAGTAASTGLSASSGVLSVTDLHSVGVSGAANQLITDDGDGTVTSEGNLSFDGSTLAVTGALTTTTTATIGTDTTLGTAGNTDSVLVQVVTNTSTNVGKGLTVAAGSSTTGSNNINGGDLTLKSGGGDGTGTSKMMFHTKISGGDGVAERMRIHTDGNLGIGDNAPGTQVQVTGAAPYLTLKNNTAENTNGGCESRIIFEDHANAPLGQIETQHKGTGDDTKGKLIISTNNGSGLQTAITVSDGQVTSFAGSVVGEGSASLREKAAADGNMAAYGQLWVKTATPNQLYFTTDAGNDIQITSGTAMAAAGVSADDVNLHLHIAVFS